MTQHQLIIEYLKEFPYIIPAKMGGKIYKEIMFGSQTDKRCRELYSPDNPYGRQILDRVRDGKFTRYFMKDINLSYDSDEDLNDKLICIKNRLESNPLTLWENGEKIKEINKALKGYTIYKRSIIKKYL